MFEFKNFKFIGFLFCLVNVIGIIILKEQRRWFHFQNWNVTKCVETLYIVKVECASSGGTDRNFNNIEIHFSCVILGRLQGFV